MISFVFVGMLAALIFLVLALDVVQSPFVSETVPVGSRVSSCAGRKVAINNSTINILINCIFNINSQNVTGSLCRTS